MKQFVVAMAATAIAALSVASCSAENEVRTSAPVVPTSAEPGGTVPPGQLIPPVASNGSESDPAEIAAAELGSILKPLGAPAIDPETCSGAASSTNSLSISLIGSIRSADQPFGAQGFSVPCYIIPSNAVTVTLTNGIVNSTTGLPDFMEMTVSTFATPVVNEEISGAVPDDPTTTDANGDTIATEPDPVIDLSNALFTSPTDADATPQSFVLPQLPTGRYLLQLPTLPYALGAVLDVTG